MISDLQPPSSRKRVLTAAHKVFLASGYNGANLRDIAREAHVSMGGIYHHFDSKEEIFRALLEEESPAPPLNELIGSLNANFPHNLNEIGGIIQRVVHEHSDFFRLVYIDLVEFGGRNLAPAMRAFRSSIIGLAEAGLRPKIEAGLLRPLHPAVFIRAILGLYLHAVLEDHMLGFGDEERGLSEGELLEGFTEILLHGIQGKAAGGDGAPDGGAGSGGSPP